MHTTCIFAFAEIYAFPSDEFHLKFSKSQNLKFLISLFVCLLVYVINTKVGYIFKICLKLFMLRVRSYKITLKKL